MWLSNLSQCFESQTPIVDEFFVGDLLKDTTANITQTWGHEWYADILLLSSFTSKVISPAKLPNPPPQKKKLHSQWHIAIFIPLRKKTSEGRSLLQPFPPCPSQPFQTSPGATVMGTPLLGPNSPCANIPKMGTLEGKIISLDHQQDFPFKRAQEMKVLALVVHFFWETCVFL